MDMKTVPRVCKLVVFATLTLSLLSRTGLAQALPFTGDWTATSSDEKVIKFISDPKTDDVGALTGEAAASAFFKGSDTTTGTATFSRPFTLPALPERATKYAITVMASMYTVGAVNSKSIAQASCRATIASVDQTFSVSVKGGPFSTQDENKENARTRFKHLALDSQVGFGGPGMYVITGTCTLRASTENAGEVAAVVALKSFLARGKFSAVFPGQ
jgi:hypothetical protein